jgi:glucose/mannose-6-phosphate isomerase
MSYLVYSIKHNQEMRKKLLDDLKLIHQRDPSDALGVAEKQPIQLTQTYGVRVTPKADIQNVVVMGMGGSGWPALYIPVWPGVRVPFQLVNDYAIPGYVSEHTLCIVASHSGNTEETLAALEAAEKTGATIVAITHGGKLLERAATQNIPCFELPGGTQPRMSTFYFIAAYIELLEQLGLVAEGSGEELRTTSEWLAQQVRAWLPTVPTAQNQAKQLAQEMIGKSVVVYGTPITGPVARKWKICINENAKHIAWWNQFPEVSHNEFIGWSQQPVDKPYCVVDLRCSLDNQRIIKRMELTDRMLSGKRPATHVVEAAGDTVLQQMLWTSVLGDFTSVYLSILNNVDPTPVDLVEKFKVALEE